MNNRKSQEEIYLNALLYLREVLEDGDIKILPEIDKWSHFRNRDLTEPIVYGDYIFIGIQKYLQIIFPNDSLENLALREVGFLGTPEFKINTDKFNKLKQAFAKWEIKLDALLNEDHLADLLYLRKAFRILTLFRVNPKDQKNPASRTYAHLRAGLLDFDDLLLRLNSFAARNGIEIHASVVQHNNELEFQIDPITLEKLNQQLTREEVKLDILSKRQRKKPANFESTIDNLSDNEVYQWLDQEMLRLLKEEAIDDLEIKTHLLTMLWFLSIEKVNPLVETYIGNHAQKSALIRRSYEQAKKEFYSNAPYCARYAKIVDLKALQKTYNNISCTDLKSIAADNMKYGEKRAALAQGLCAQLEEGAITATPTGKSFLSLPPSSKGTRKVASLLEKISAWTYNNQDQDDFKTLRTQQYWHTPIIKHYTWALPLIHSIFNRSLSDDVRSRSQNFDGYLISYLLNYTSTGKKIDEIELGRVFSLKSTNRWKHGLAKLSDTWTDIEDLFETLWAMDLKKPEQNSEQDAYEKNLTVFYSAVAKLLWLIGNTQPVNRGTGTFAELMLAIVHLHHGLQPPILKLEFPQLDVLDITFPVNDYKYFFPYFFEPSTMPPHLRSNPAMSSLSLNQQMEKLYEKFNSQEQIRMDAEKQQEIINQEIEKKLNAAIEWLVQRLEDIASVEQRSLKLFSNDLKTMAKAAKQKSFLEVLAVLLNEYTFQKKQIMKAKKDINVVEEVNRNKHNYRCLRIIAMTLNEIYSHYSALIPEALIMYRNELNRIEAVNYSLISAPKLNESAIPVQLQGMS